LVNYLNSILPLQHTQQLNLNTLILLAITTYHNLGDVPSILLALTVLSSLYRSLTLSLCFCIIFPTISALLAVMQNLYTRLSTN
jgi:hypothetical protein